MTTVSILKSASIFVLNSSEVTHWLWLLWSNPIWGWKPFGDSKVFVFSCESFLYSLCRLPFPYFTKVPSLWYLWLRHWYVKEIRIKIKSVPWMPYILKAYLEGGRHSPRPLTNQYGAMRYLRRRAENRGMLGKKPRDKWLHANLFHPLLRSRTSPSISCHSLHKSAVHCSLNWTLDSKKIVFKVGNIMEHIMWW